MENSEIRKRSVADKQHATSNERVNKWRPRGVCIIRSSNTITLAKLHILLQLISKFDLTFFTTSEGIAPVRTHPLKHEFTRND
ncbi:unnamed protein product [Sphenostylis stenocarpa]|uniref:Uncharacterized protein n=1 Tax=Sphenostylis stenocarpa TaxID=92480 RepID=A0AA87BBZ1_9FABA|nr:unnamed protein product [Sphenostylis stenocarpa]